MTDEHESSAMPYPFTAMEYTRELRIMGYKAEATQPIEELKRTYRRAIQINADNNDHKLRGF